MSNIIQFPKPTNLPVSPADSKGKIEEVRKMHTEEISIELLEIISNIAQNYGYFSRETESLEKDFIILKGIIEAILLRDMNIHHPLQTILDNAEIIEVEEDH